MKKKVLGFLLCFCLTAGMMSGCGTDSGSETNDTEQTEDVGAVGTIGAENGSEAETAGGETETPPEEAAETVYYLAKEIVYMNCRNVDVDFCVEYEYEYDVNGNLIRESHFRHDRFDTATGQFSHSETITEYGYDEAGNVLFEETSRGDSDSRSRIEYKYDGNGNLLSDSKGTQYYVDNY